VLTVNRIRLSAATWSLLLGGSLLAVAPAAGAHHAEAFVRGSACTPHQALATWSLRRLAWQTVVVPAQETDVGAVGGLVAAGAGGVILFGNHAPADLGAQLRRLTSRAPHGIRPFVMTDEEGGSVQRMANLVGSVPSARTMGATMTADQIHRLARRVGGRMAAAGITMDLAPVLDLDAGPGPNADNPIGTRSFSARASVASRDGLAFAQGLSGSGVVPVVKHFPGLGGATGNTEVHAASTRPWTVLQEHGLKPFEAAVRAGVPVVMTSNARVPGVSSAPSSLSHAVTKNVLRRKLGFTGLVITDALSAGAIVDAGYRVPGATVRALRVGADMVLFNAADGDVGSVATATVRAVVASAHSGGLPRRRLETAVLHGLTARGVDPCARDGSVRTPAARAAGPTSARPGPTRRAGSPAGRRTPQ
jgi:beta-N-acetylhexosaminidase